MDQTERLIEENILMCLRYSTYKINVNTAVKMKSGSEKEQRKLYH